MSWIERTFTFACAGETLIGIMSLPELVASGATLATHEEVADTGVVVIVGGPQYRAGSHRQFTLLARAMAEAGFPVLRFDYRGMGDSTGVQRNFEAVNDDVAAAIGELLQRQPTIRRVVLWGLCDGASAALLYLHATRDPRVHGLCIANPWVRTESGLARTHMKHYYLRRLRQPEFWRKAFSGQVTGKAAAEWWRNLIKSYGCAERSRNGADAMVVRTAPFQECMAEAAAQFNGDLLLVISGKDLTAMEFVEYVRGDTLWQQALGKTTSARLDFADTDHTFSASGDLQGLQLAMVRWLGREGQPKISRALTAS